MSPWLTKNRFPIQFKPFNQSAEVAELADALRSGRSELTLVRVQIPPPAQQNFYKEIASKEAISLTLSDS